MASIAIVLMLIARTASLGIFASDTWYVRSVPSRRHRRLLPRPHRLADGDDAAGPQRTVSSASAGQPSGDTVAAALLVAAIVGAVLLLFAGGSRAAILALAGGFVTAASVRLGSLQQIGGQTGDVCGATAVLSETAMLAIAAATIG